MTTMCIYRHKGTWSGICIDVHFSRSVRVICLDANNRLLLLRWRDPVDGTILWEPPGGKIEAGETPVDAARRELHEETGVSGDLVLDVMTVVERDVLGVFI
jgi:8-oxo-dGTP pyrophosphatase MutT (NUDIX family)